MTKVQPNQPTIHSLVQNDIIITDRDEIDKVACEYYAKILKADSCIDLGPKLDITREGIFTLDNVDLAMKETNFSKAIGLDEFDGNILKNEDLKL